MITTISKPNLSLEIKNRIIQKALLIRKTERLLLDLYSTGELFGTVHTCIGQEFVGAIISEFFQPGDSVFSNHRCHGHFLSITADAHGLIAEIFGKQNGVCGGRGGSQHLCKNGFYSNGIQGGIAPVSAGLAFARKIRKQGISIVFLGDGTLGEGVLYETFNICSKWKLPLVFVLENNNYAQSTHQSEVLAGNIEERAKAFAIKTAHANTWDWVDLYHVAEKMIRNAREHSEPCFLQIDTYRLHAHSKGDDNRSFDEVNEHNLIDPLNLIIKNNPSYYSDLEDNIDAMLTNIVSEVRSSTHSQNFISPMKPLIWSSLHLSTQSETIRMGFAINKAIHHLMATNDKIYFLGEDVKSPYGGAFKISEGLSDFFPDRVLNTPISESAIVGIGIGLAMGGYRPIVEIMFGDFITLAMDQLINHAAKFRYMYNEQVRVPLVIRTPMGGRRGYGPTHSQTLDRHLLGVPGLRIIAINNMLPPSMIYNSILAASEDPTIIIENKLLYTLPLRETAPEGFSYQIISTPCLGVLMEPECVESDLCIIAYGGLSELIIDVVTTLFIEFDIIAQFICPVQIYPFDIKAYISPIQNSSAIVVVEEGQGFAGFGAELLAQLYTFPQFSAKAMRIYAEESSIPASKLLEEKRVNVKSGVWLH